MTYSRASWRRHSPALPDRLPRAWHEESDPEGEGMLLHVKGARPEGECRMSSPRRCSAVFFSFLAIVASSTRAFGDSRTIGFENPPYTTGSIDGQDGWGGQNPPGIPINPSIDQAVSSALANTGTQSSR